VAKSRGVSLIFLLLFVLRQKVSIKFKLFNH